MNYLSHIVQSTSHIAVTMQDTYGRNFTRCLAPGADISAEPPEVQAAAAETWTPEVIAAYQARLAELEPPAKTLGEIAADMEKALEHYTDTVANNGPRRYRSAESCVSYADDPDPAVAAEAAAFTAWRSAFWAAADQMKADVLAGLRPIPTLAEAIAELPQIQWPA